MDTIISVRRDGSKPGPLGQLTLPGTTGTGVPPDRPAIEVVTIADRERAAEFQALLQRLRA